MPTRPDDPRYADADHTGVVTRVSTFAAGDVLCSRFRVERFIASGGMGELYAARDLALGELVALKTVRPEIALNPRAHQRFLREVQLARKVTHANICRIFDLFQHAATDGATTSSKPVSFVTMELLNGETLADRLRREGRLTVEQAMPLVRQMAAALSAAHAAGVVHRDFKTGNVMLLDAESGDAPRVVVTDFGLAYRVGETGGDDSAPMTLVGEILGTPGYMAPEQFEGSAITPATDIYAFGAVLYELVTGTLPFADERRAAGALNRGPGPVPPRELVPGLPDRWNDTILRCLARSPHARFATADEVLGALEGSAASRRWASRPAALAAGVVAAIALLAVLLVSWEARDADSALDPPAAPSPQSMRPSVAVLGFRNLAGRQDTDWLSTALAEMLSAELAAGESLRAIPGETIHRMKADLALADADSYAAETLARIRDSLGSDLVVSGSYVTVGGENDAEMRVDVRLQDSRAGETIAVITETGRTATLFELVSRVGAALRSRIGVQSAATATARTSLPSSPEAARLYSEGLTRLRQLDALGARELLERAIEADAEFPLAHSALAATWASLGYDNRALAAAERALALSGELPRAERLQVDATYREMARAWSEAIAIWQTLVTFFPDDIEHVLRLADAQQRSGAPRDAVATIEAFRARFPGPRDPRLDLAVARAAEPLSDFARMQAAAVAAATLGSAQGARRLVADARLLEGGALVRQGRVDEAMPLFEEARATYEQAGDRNGVARTLNNMGIALTGTDDRDGALAFYEEGLAIAREIGNQDLVARFLNNAAILHRRGGDFARALAMNQEALGIRRDSGDRTNAAVSLNNIGNILLELGDFDGASRHYQESAEVSRAVGDRSGLARALRNAGEALLRQGQLARARTLNEEALAIRRGIDDPASVSTSLYALGRLLSLGGRLSDAKQRLEESVDIERRLGSSRTLAYSLFELGEVTLLMGNLDDAESLHEEALAIRERLAEPAPTAESQMALAVVALEHNRAGEAEALARSAAEGFAGATAAPGEAEARAVLARALLAQDRLEDARGEIARARALLVNPQQVLSRLPVAIAGARIDARTDAAAAVQALDELRADAVERGLTRFAFDARRAIADIEEQRAPDAGAAAREALRRDALASGVLLYAR